MSAPGGTRIQASHLRHPMSCMLQASVATGEIHARDIVTDSPVMALLEPIIARARFPPISVYEYVRRVHDFRQTLDRLSTGRAGRLRTIARQMEAMGQVQAKGGHAITTPLPAWGRSLASGRPSQLQAVRRELRALDSALHSLRSRQWRPGQLHQLDSILRDSRFHPHLNAVQAAEAWLGDRATQILQFLARHIGLSGLKGSPTMNAVVAIGFLLLVAGVATLIARAAIRRGAVSIPAREGQTEEASPTAARQRAGELASAGSYREAFRYLFLATLLDLRDAGLIQLRPGDTNREYAFSLDAGSETPQQEALVALVDEFDRVWYGHRPLTRAQYQHCASLAASVIAVSDEGQIA